MPKSSTQPAASSVSGEVSGAPSDRMIAVGAAGVALWVLTWLAVQLHTTFGWAVPLLPGVR